MTNLSELRLLAFEPLAFPWPEPPAGEEGEPPVAMRALVEQLDPMAEDLRLVRAGETFLVRAGPRPWTFLLAGMAELAGERPGWWPETTPSAPPRAIGTRTVEPKGGPEARRLIRRARSGRRRRRRGGDRLLASGLVARHPADSPWWNAVGRP